MNAGHVSLSNESKGIIINIRIHILGCEYLFIKNYFFFRIQWKLKLLEKKNFMYVQNVGNGLHARAA